MIVWNMIFTVIAIKGINKSKQLKNDLINFLFLNHENLLFVQFLKLSPTKIYEFLNS